MVFFKTFFGLQFMKYSKPMELKDILALRLRALMDARPDLDTQAKVHKKTGLSQSTIQRILKREVSTGLDVVETLASAYRVGPLSLISPIESPLESIAPSYDEIELIKSWRNLSEFDKHKVMAYISIASAAKKGHDVHEAKNINPDSVVEISPTLRQAVMRASSASVESKTELNINHGDKEEKSRPIRHKTGTKS
jgi:transcriptional regulator with XRE-family HTH domain